MEYLVFLPGLLNTESLWYPVLDYLLANKKFRKYIHPIHLPIHYHPSIKQIASTILAHPQLSTRFSLIGFSMGGYVASEIICQAPERVIRLALLNSKVICDSKHDNKRQKINLSIAQKIIDPHQFIGVSPHFFRFLVGIKARDNIHIANHVFSMAHKIGLSGFLCQQQAIINRCDTSMCLKRYNHPVLLLTGDQDKIIKSEDTFAVLPRGKKICCIIKGIGHLSPLEAPDQVAHYIMEWFDL